MARTKPTRVFTVDDPNNPDKQIEVGLSTEAAIFSVMFDSQAISLRTTHVQQHGPKYLLVSIPHQGHAHRLCAKLRHITGDNRFEVHRLDTGEVVRPKEEIVIRPRRRTAGRYDSKELGVASAGRACPRAHPASPELEREERAQGQHTHSTTPGDFRPHEGKP